MNFRGTTLRKKLISFVDFITGGRIKKTMKEFDLPITNKKQLQQERLKNLLRHAITTVPYYKSYDNFESLTDFPVINKKIIKEHYDDFISEEYNKDSLIPVTTSGSTGTPFTYLFDKRKKRRRTLEVIYYNGWANYELGDRHLLNAVGSHKSKLKLFLQNEVITNPLHLDLEWLEKQRTALKNDHITLYVGYASAIQHFTEYCKKKNDGPADFDLKGIISIAENLDEHVRKDAETVFGCPVLSRYASLETGVLSQECQEEKNHHVNISSYAVELLSFDSDDPVNPGELGRVVVTDLFSYGMPLIRYDIGDVAMKAETNCSCGIGGPIFKKIRGRITDNVLDQDGNLVSWAAINVIIWPYKEIKEFRFIQTDRFKFELLLSTYDGTRVDKEIIKKFKELLGEKSEIDITYLEEIPSLESGKRPYIINRYLKNKSQ